MAQVTAEQQEQWQATIERFSAKLQTFHEELTADEQVVLNLALRHVAVRAAETDEDVVGHVGPVAVFIAGAILGGMFYDAVKAGVDAVVDQDAGHERPTYERGNQV